MMGREKKNVNEFGWIEMKKGVAYLGDWGGLSKSRAFSSALALNYYNFCFQTSKRPKGLLCVAVRLILLSSRL
jgi:hypothetical protein